MANGNASGGSGSGSSDVRSGGRAALSVGASTLTDAEHDAGAADAPGTPGSATTATTTTTTAEAPTAPQIKPVKTASEKFATKLANRLSSAIDDEDGASRIAPTRSHSTQPAMEKRWVKGKLLGSGAYGNVFVGLDENGAIAGSAGQFFAAKQMQLTGGHSEAKQDELIQEIEMLLHLDHPNIVRYLGNQIEEDGASAYIFMEYCSGVSTPPPLLPLSDYQSCRPFQADLTPPRV
jgi:hypothetical protein